MNIKAKIYTYKEVYTASLTLYADGNVRIDNKFAQHVQGTINKMACVNMDNDWDLISLLAGETNNSSIAPGSSLYVASECKAARDTFRNSGYSITRSPDKADVIVVPDVKADNYYSLTYNIVGYDEENENLYLYHVEKPGYLISQLSTQDIAQIRKYLRSRGVEPCEIDRERVRIWFLPKCGEIRNILEGNTLSNIPYLQESSVPIKASTQISPETLMFWENINDANLLVRTICTSDWMDYPVTLLAFLSCFKTGINWYANANNDFRRILKSIGYEGYWSSDYLFTNERSITPKDYEMLQSYIIYRLGIDKNGGLVSAKSFTEIPSALRRLLLHKAALKPMTIPARMTLGQVCALANQ